ncbi:MAG: threonylcarbamoyl-AMP synthase [Clostridiales bacterium]|nr:threonylcarbamoyl-AMP synthase [Clostridiales bacterium]
MKTEILKIKSPQEKEKIQKAARILQKGGLVAIPTETVYGLAANALDKSALAKIFKAKGRPVDNPLIVHVCKVEQLYNLVTDLSEEACLLAEAFWPGPLTLVLEKSPTLPKEVSAGLETLAVRMPDHPIALAILEEANIPLAAPSANLSGSPSPTCAAHVADDLVGRIDAIVDSGACSVGLESTVLSLVGPKACILRPGGVTRQAIEDVIGSVELDPGVFRPLEGNQAPLSPGLKYKHYAPKASLILVEGSLEGFIELLSSVEDKKGIGALCFDGEEKMLPLEICVSYGPRDDSEIQAKRLFSALRALDELPGLKTIYARSPKGSGMGLAVYNRLLRSAAFDLIKTK